METLVGIATLVTSVTGAAIALLNQRRLRENELHARQLAETAAAAVIAASAARLAAESLAPTVAAIAAKVLP